VTIEAAQEVRVQGYSFSLWEKVILGTPKTIDVTLTPLVSMHARRVMTNVAEGNLFVIHPRGVLPGARGPQDRGHRCVLPLSRVRGGALGDGRGQPSKLSEDPCPSPRPCTAAGCTYKGLKNALRVGKDQGPGWTSVCDGCGKVIGPSPLPEGSSGIDLQVMSYSLQACGDSCLEKAVLAISTDEESST
jgi:hypothetical protein